MEPVFIKMLQAIYKTLTAHSSIMNTGQSWVHQLHTQMMPVQMNLLSPLGQASFCSLFWVTNCSYSNQRRKHDKGSEISLFSCFWRRNKLSASIESYGRPLATAGTEFLLSHPEHSPFPVSVPTFTSVPWEAPGAKSVKPGLLLGA